MTALRRIVFEEACLAAGFLIAAWYTFYVAAIWGLAEIYQDGPMKAYLTGPGIHVEMILSGLLFGGVLAVVNRLTEHPRFRQQPFGRIILLKTGIFLLGLLLAVLAVNGVLLAFVYSSAELAELHAFMSFRLTFGLFFWIGMTVLAANFLLEVRRKMGPGKLWALIRGRYHHPREEDRVFLFLDLKGSTSIAEELGHARYSQLLRSCFHDLTDYVLSARAEVYQFVGDEVVLTWPGNRPQVGQESLGLFFSFQSRLRQKRLWYEERFGTAPEFRGGLERGPVTATEVGDIKREIAFHGDPLNTAARLLELCHDYQRPVLISGRIQQALGSESRFSTTLEGEILLRGKTEPLPVFGVSETLSTLA